MAVQILIFHPYLPSRAVRMHHRKLTVAEERDECARLQVCENVIIFPFEVHH